MKCWGELSWKDIYAEHRPLVDRVFEADERINYLPRMYDSETIERVKVRCVEGLGELVDTFRKEHSEATEPKDTDWALFLWHRDNKAVIKRRLDSDLELRKIMKEYHQQYTRNISICIAQEYNALINDINSATYLK